MRAIRLSAFMLGGLALCGCAATKSHGPTASIESVQASDSKQQIHALLADQQAAWNAGDIDGFMQGYWKSPQLRFASRDSITYGWDETLAQYKLRYTDRSVMGTLKFDILETKVHTQDDAMLFGRWTLLRPEKGDIGGLFTLVLRRIDGQWRIVSDHTS